MTRSINLREDDEGYDDLHFDRTSSARINDKQELDNDASTFQEFDDDPEDPTFTAWSTTDEDSSHFDHDWSVPRQILVAEKKKKLTPLKAKLGSTPSSSPSSSLLVRIPSASHRDSGSQPHLQPCNSSRREGLHSAKVTASLSNIPLRVPKRTIRFQYLQEGAQHQLDEAEEQHKQQEAQNEEAEEEEEKGSKHFLAGRPSSRSSSTPSSKRRDPSSSSPLKTRVPLPLLLMTMEPMEPLRCATPKIRSSQRTPATSVDKKAQSMHHFRSLFARNSSKSNELLEMPRDADSTSTRRQQQSRGTGAPLVSESRATLTPQQQQQRRAIRVVEKQRATLIPSTQRANLASSSPSPSCSSTSLLDPTATTPSTTTMTPTSGSSLSKLCKGDHRGLKSPYSRRASGGEEEEEVEGASLTSGTAEPNPPVSSVVACELLLSAVEAKQRRRLLTVNDSKGSEHNSKVLVLAKASARPRNKARARTKPSMSSSFVPLTSRANKNRSQDMGNSGHGDDGDGTGMIHVLAQFRTPPFAEYQEFGSSR